MRDLGVRGIHRCSRCILAVVGIVTVSTLIFWSNHLPYIMDIALSEDDKKDLHWPPALGANFTAAEKNRTTVAPTETPSSQPTSEPSSSPSASPSSAPTPSEENVTATRIDEAWPPSSVISKVTKGGESRVVIASFNCQNLQFADNWANSLLSQGTHNFVFVPIDNTTEKILKEEYPDNTVPMMPGAGGDDLNRFARYGTQEFKRLTSARARMINAFLRKNVTVLYNDVDIVWKAKIWDDLDDIVKDASNDGVDAIFQEDGLYQYICTCIIFMVPCQSNFRLLEKWQHAIDTGNYSDDQFAFNNALKTDHGVKWKLLPKSIFPSGKEYFRHNKREGVHLVHANYMVGQTSKYTRLKYSGNWHPTGRLDNKLPECAVIPEDPIDTSIETKMYKSNVTSLMKRKNTVCMKPREASLDMTMALSCLHSTTPSLQLEYPSDADLHLNEIRLALAPWAQHGSHKAHSYGGYGGPWIENRWITHFETIYQENKTACASHIFGPFIPIFIPWTDHWVNKKAYQNLLDRLSDVLRPNVPYITVSQNDQGIPGRYNFDQNRFPNLLVLSAGGYGHIPIPSLKQQEKRRSQEKTMSQRSSLLSFAGSLNTAPLCQEMHSYLSAVDDSKINNGSNVTTVYTYYKGEKWRDTMLSSQLSMCPRGFGRTSFRLTEALQLGLIPIYVYSDVAWVPYADLFEQIGFITNMTSISQLIDELLETPISKLEQMEERVAILAKSHFSPEGILRQISLFMTGNENDLRCQALPATLRGY